MKLISIFFILLNSVIKSDLPINCLKSETVGIWEFKISEMQNHAYYS